MISIHRATTQDSEAISQIGKIAFEESHKDSCSAQDIASFIKEYYNPNAIHEELKDPKNIYHVLSYDGKPAGFSKIILDFEHANIAQKNVAKLDRIYFLKAYYGMKLGHDLLEFNVELCKASNQSGIWLFTWTGNLRAVNFYQKIGFQIIGHHLYKITDTQYNPNHQMLLEFKC